MSKRVISFSVSLTLHTNNAKGNFHMTDKNEVQYVPVLDKNNQPLMPCHPARARQLLRKGKAVRRWFRGVFAIKLTDRVGGATQSIVVGVDPGSKMEGYTVKSPSHTFLNIQSTTVDWVKPSLCTRYHCRRSRRQRKSPNRKGRLNRASLKKTGVRPSVKARWDLKLRIIKYLKRLYPITDIIVEDIKAETKKGKHRWNKSFSPLQTGKNWFYEECRQLGNLTIIRGFDTSEFRKNLGLAKNKSDKLKYDFDVHCVDSWVIANSVVGGHNKPDLTKVFCIKPFRWHRRQLHVMNFKKGGVRRGYGGTRSLGFTRGSLAIHETKGLCYIGGSHDGGVSLHHINTGKRFYKRAKVLNVTFLTYLPWRWSNAKFG